MYYCMYNIIVNNIIQYVVWLFFSPGCFWHDPEYSPFFWATLTWLREINHSRSLWWTGLDHGLSRVGIHRSFASLHQTNIFSVFFVLGVRQLWIRKWEFQNSLRNVPVRSTAHSSPSSESELELEVDEE